MKSYSIIALGIIALFAVNIFAADRNVEYRLGGARFQRVWDDFYKEPVWEPEIADPLVAAGKEMTETICKAIKHPDMKLRRYAISALGFIGDKRAIPTLELILQNESEKEYFRADALRSIYLIDESLGTCYAHSFVIHQDYLRFISDAILKKEPWLKEPLSRKEW